MALTDFTYSKDVFQVVKCKSCDFHFTNPIPTEEEIGNYYKSEEYISHTSTSKGLVNKLYNLVRNFTLKQKVDLLKDLIPDLEKQHVLDFGSGTGHFLNKVKRASASAEGIEPDEDARKFALDNFSVNLHPTSFLDVLEEEKYAVITSWHVVEHIYHLKRDLLKLTNSIKKGGYYIIAVPNRESYDAKVYGSFWAAYDVPRHLYHFTEKDIVNLMEQFSFTKVKTIGMKFDSFYVSMLSEKYKGGSIVSAFVNGLKSNLKAKNGGFSSQIYIFRKN